MRARIGNGPLQPPIKLPHLTPAYPESLRANGDHGAVILEALVSADGSFQVLNVLTPVDPDLLTPVQPELARAAVDAARQWQYEPTRLHGVPVDTPL
jgi:TonB family protein